MKTGSRFWVCLSTSGAIALGSVYPYAAQAKTSSIGDRPDIQEILALEENHPHPSVDNQHSPTETHTLIGQNPQFPDTKSQPSSIEESNNPLREFQLEPQPVGIPQNNSFPPANFQPTATPPATFSPLPFPNNGDFDPNIPSQEALDADYALGAGDTIRLEFFNVPEFDNDYLINTDGSITAPLVGRIYLKGLTTKEAGDRLTAAYASELQFPEVTVSLIARRPLQIVITGEIVQPGLYTFPSNTQGQAPRIYQALQTAQGITAAGDIEKIQVTRNSKDPSLSHTLSIDLLALIQRGDLTQNIDLRDGDIISIPAATSINAANIKQLQVSNARSRSTEPVDVSILGEVSRPGPYRFSPNDQATLIQAIQQAGGLSPFSDISSILLERQTRNGEIQAVNVDLFAILEEGRIEQDIPLQTGDVITIPEGELSNENIGAIAESTLSTGPIQVAILGEVLRPGPVQIQPNASLSQAVLAAGGFNGLAKKNVKLLRFNPDGTVTERRIRVDFDRTTNPEDNPILKPNDIVMVGKSTWGSIRDALGSITRDFNFFLPYLFFLNDDDGGRFPF